MYHLKCSYYKKKFNTIYELLDDIVLSGMDPNYLVYKDGKSVGTKAIDLIQFWFGYPKISSYIQANKGYEKQR